MKIISAAQTRALDEYTIENEPIDSLDLMERASLSFVNWFTNHYAYLDYRVDIFCGPGNNGGDGLAIARLLHHASYSVRLHICKIGNQTSLDFDRNLKRLPKHAAIEINTYEVDAPFPVLSGNTVIIDGIFGSGLNRPVEGYWAAFIKHLNQSSAVKVAIDIPSGLFADQHTAGTSFEADRTFSFELPKLAFMLPENAKAVGRWDVDSIGLSQYFLETLNTKNHYIDLVLVQRLYKPRAKFSHKGSFGHALLLAGSYGMIGAAILSTKAALRSGAGLVTLHAPKVAYSIIQSAIPEAMVSVDPEENMISELPVLAKFSSVGIGPGIQNNSLTINTLKELIKTYTSPLVLDADALNILSKSPELLSILPANSILTPHPKEFERLFGKSTNDFDRINLQRTKAKALNVIIILKGAHTCIATPQGACYFNSTGNPGMASGGSGDVLTGILTSLLAQGYSPFETSVLGVYLHGLAGDLALKTAGSEEALIASDIIEHIGFAFQKIK